MIRRMTDELLIESPRMGCAAKTASRSMGHKLLALGLVLLLAACSPAPDTSPDPADTSTSTEPSARIPAMTLPPELEAATVQAREDLAARLEVAADAVTVIEARLVTWRNGAMGCPQPDMMYTQALVPGYRILLQAGKSVHAYHGARGGRPSYCPVERAGEPLPEPNDVR